MTQDQLRERLRREAAKTSVAAVARHYGIDYSYMFRSVRGDLPISQRLARAMGYERVVRFRKLDGAQADAE